MSQGRGLVPTFFLSLWLFAGLFWMPMAATASELIQALDVHREAQGGVVAQATLHLSVSPLVVQEVLTDYEHWPELFTVSMRIARVERYPDRAVTDIYLNHGFLSGERRLLCENREFPGGGLSTTLLEGDFKRYSRTWKVSPQGRNGGTKAEFRLEIEVDTWAPDWLVAVMLKQELESHFSILKKKTEQRAGLSTGH